MGDRKFFLQLTTDSSINVENQGTRNLKTLSGMNIILQYRDGKGRVYPVEPDELILLGYVNVPTGLDAELKIVKG